jgi:AraC family transcriptional regulator of adaptative response/methylated-DNA-[protein]-cysteine methyltransferase
MRSLPPVKEMERAFNSRDSSYDGIFFSGVRTTGIFCRPSCPARKPRPKNVEYFKTAREAVFAGYRPCQRCRPMEANGKPPGWVADLLDKVEQDPTSRLTDKDLRKLGLEPARVRRYFLKTYGMTFHAFRRGRRMGDALTEIRQGAELDDVILGHGFESHSGFRDAFSRTFGKPPGRSRDQDCLVVDWIETPLGPMVVAANREGICMLEFTDRRMLETQFKTLQKRFDCAVVPGKNRHSQLLSRELKRYFTGDLKRFEVPLVIDGTPFQEQVWKQLLKIPYGKTRSYEQIARAVGRPNAQRAVGTANGQNRMAILIPCHRVVNKSGGLGGYGGGLWRKRRLLSLEQGEATLPGLDG